MPAITSFVLQYTNVNFNNMQASTFDLIITEGAPLPRSGSFPQLTDAQVALLQAQGRTVAGYVNVAVTDAFRRYWNSAWTNNGDDLGVLTGSAPSWLQGQPTNAFGYIVKFWDSAWQQIVIDQAVDLVSRGYRAIFLDDVAQYFVLGNLVGVPRIRELATLMAEFVATIANAVRQINPNAVVIVNGDPYHVTNVTNDARGSNAVSAFLNAVDFHLMENQSTTAIEYAGTVMPSEPLLILDTRSTPAYSVNDAWLRGIPYYTSGYDTLSTFSYRSTGGADTLFGGDGPNLINGLAGNDVLFGGGGNDVLDGGSGLNSLFGDAGNDRLLVAADGSGTNVDGGVHLDTLVASGAVTLGTVGSMEAIELVAGAALTLTNAQLTGGFVSNTAVSGTGTLTINMDAPGIFTNKQFIFNGTGVSVIVNGTSGNDVIKVGNARHTINTGDGGNIVQGGNQVDTVTGGTGIDKIAGNGGADVVSGGAGNDVFKFRNANDSGLGAAADRITDFTIGSDRLNFVKIDANAALAGDQAFSFVGTAAFANTGLGQIRYLTSGADLLVQSDVNGDGVADMEIILQGRGGQTLTAADFVL